MVELIFNEKANERLIEKRSKQAEKQAKKQAKIDMAKKMLLKNKPIAEIIEFTELTKTEILKIKKTLNTEE